MSRDNNELYYKEENKTGALRSTDANRGIEMYKKVWGVSFPKQEVLSQQFISLKAIELIGVLVRQI
jgi:hypothetical protein